MKTKRRTTAKCSHCHRIKPINKVLALDLFFAGGAFIHEREICVQCWKDANYELVTGLRVK